MGGPFSLSIILTHLDQLPLKLFRSTNIPEPAVAPQLVLKPILEAIGEDARKALSLVILLEQVNLANVLEEMDLEPAEACAIYLPVLTSHSLVERAAEAYIVPAVVVQTLIRTDRSTLQRQLNNVVAVLAQRFPLMHRTDEITVALAQVAAQCANICYILSDLKAIQPLTIDPVLEHLNKLGFWKEYAVILQIGLEIARRKEDRSQQIFLGCRLARKFLQVGDFYQAKTIFSRISLLDDRSLEPELKAEILSHRAIFRDASGDAEGARRDFLQSVENHVLANDSTGKASVLYLLAMQVLRYADLKGARSYFEDALKEIEDLKFSKINADINIGLGECDLAGRDFMNAERRFNRSLAECDEIDYLAARPRALVGLAMATEALNRIPEAISFAKRADAASVLNNTTVGKLARSIVKRLTPSAQEENTNVESKVISEFPIDQQRVEFERLISDYRRETFNFNLSQTDCEKKLRDFYVTIGRDIAELDPILSRINEDLQFTFIGG